MDDDGNGHDAAERQRRQVKDMQNAARVGQRVVSAFTQSQLRTLAALRRYMIEGAVSAIIMICMSAFIILFEHPASPANQFLSQPILRRACNGAIMGAIIASLIASPWGRRSGAHFNPAVTLAMWSVGSIRPMDALAYVAAQLMGAILGMALSAVLLGAPLAHPQINFAVTQVGDSGVAWAFLAEFAMSFCLMFMVSMVTLRTSRPEWVPGLVGGLIAAFIALEAPVSGMSLNPARTLASAVLANHYDALWLYFAAPLGGMLCAAMLAHHGFARRRPQAVPDSPPAAIVAEYAARTGKPLSYKVR